VTNAAPMVIMRLALTPTGDDTVLLENQRRKVIEIAQKALQQGLVYLTGGNFSLRDRETGYICITPSGMSYPELQPEDIVVMDTEGRTIDGNRKPSIEWRLHSLAYQKRVDVNGVCHTHSDFATAWASVEEEFPLILAELASALGSKLRTAPFRPMGSSELAQVTVQTLGDSNAVLMSNHGQLAVGPTLEQAYINALVVEEGARIAAYAKGLGKLKIISPQQASQLKKWLEENYGQKK